jgi:hypothetical protein
MMAAGSCCGERKLLSDRGFSFSRSVMVVRRRYLRVIYRRRWRRQDRCARRPRGAAQKRFRMNRSMPEARSRGDGLEALGEQRSQDHGGTHVDRVVGSWTCSARSRGRGDAESAPVPDRKQHPPGGRRSVRAELAPQVATGRGTPGRPGSHSRAGRSQFPALAAAS